MYPQPPQQPQNSFAPQAPKPMRPPQAPQVNPYDDFRKQAQLRNQAQQQQNQTALQRRFAQLGGGPSGAQMKMEQDVQRQGNDDLSNQIGSINAQEAQGLQQQNQFQQQFGLEQMKTLQGLDLAKRAQGLEEQGQFFNQAQAQLASAYNAPRFEAEMARYNDILNGQLNPMQRRLLIPQPAMQPAAAAPAPAPMYRGDNV